MRVIFQRAILPIVLLAIAVASLVDGYAHRTRTVIDEQKVEEKITIPTSFDPPPETEGAPGGEGLPGAFAGGAPFMQPPPIVQYVTRTIRTPKEEPESRLVFEVSIGGLELNQDTGELKRTYSGKAPSLCPS